MLTIPLSLFRLLALHTAADVLVFPLWALAAVVLCRRTPVCRAAAVGLLGGLVAVTAYDMLRLPFVLFGGWPDFIPRVGGWVIHSGQPNATAGYLWRYIGDGGGIGVVFALICLLLGLRSRLTLLGCFYGVFVWSGLMGTLLLAPQGQTLLFRITPATLALSLAGHLVYGSVLGWTVQRLDRRRHVLGAPPLTVALIHGRRVRAPLIASDSADGDPTVVTSTVVTSAAVTSTAVISTAVDSGAGATTVATRSSPAAAAPGSRSSGGRATATAPSSPDPCS